MNPAVSRYNDPNARLANLVSRTSGIHRWVHRPTKGNYRPTGRQTAVEPGDVGAIDPSKDKLIQVARSESQDAAKVGTTLDKHGLSYGKFDEGRSSVFVTSGINTDRAKGAIKEDASKRGYVLLTRLSVHPDPSHIMMFAPSNSHYAAIKVEGKYKDLLYACARHWQWSDSVITGDTKKGFTVVLGPKSGVQAVIDIREDSLARGYDYVVVYRK